MKCKKTFSDSNQWQVLESLLREKDELFENVFDYAPIGMALVGVDGTFVRGNRFLCQMLGYSEGQLLTLRFQDITHPEDVQEDLAQYEKVLTGEIDRYQLEKRYFHRLGYPIWVLLSVSLVRDIRGKPRYAIAQIQDITGHKRLVEALQTSEGRFRQLAENAQDIIYRYRVWPIPRFEYINRICTVITGYTPEEHYADPELGWKLVHPEDLHLMEDIVNPSQRNKKPITLRWITKDGKVKWIEHRRVAFYNDTGQLTTIEGIARDITETMGIQSQMARLESFNLLAEMAAGVGHEVRNPMTVVRGFLQMLEEKEEFSQYLDYITLMVDELDRANAIITEYLTLARSPQPEHKLQSLNDIIANLYPLLVADAMLGEKNIKKRLEYIPDLQLDVKEVRQLILNLVRNGLDAMEPGGTVTLCTFREGDSVVLEIRDEGKGIDPEVMDRLGKAFFTTKEGGTGLGLSVCYNIAARHKARIDVKTGGGGTSFFVYFPIEF